MSLSFEILAIISLGGWLIIAVLACLSVYNVQRDRSPIVVERQTGAVLIIPIRGVPKNFQMLWQGICAQSDRPSRVIFSIESRKDPAFRAVKSLTGGPPTEIVIAGATIDRGQKIHNLLAALTHVRRTEDVIVFADADISPDPYWLARLIRGLDDAYISSGYRWMVPADDRWATIFMCVANSSVATAQRRLWNLGWGGSIAVRQEFLNDLQIETIWRRALSDDLALSRAIKRRGFRMNGQRDALVQSPVSFDWRNATAFGRRQYLLVRMYSPLHWILAATVTTVPLLGWMVALSLALQGSVIAIGIIVIANALDHLRAYFRRRVNRKLWHTEISDRVAWLDSWGTPAVLAVHALVIWSTLFGRSVTWAGRIYWLDSCERVYRIKDISNQKTPVRRARDRSD